MTMTPDAKSELSKTIRRIRERLLTDLHDANERAYRLGVPIAKAKLNEEATIRRQRMEAWIDEQIRAETRDEKRDAISFRKEIEKQAAYTFLNRIVILRLMESWGLRGPAVATKGWDSKGYKDFRQLARTLVQVDKETEGFGFLLKLIFEDLAIDLPGLYGSGGLADQVPIPPATMRYVIEELDADVMESCWTDDMTLGWVYQYWNDPEREALDDKINDGGKIEPHEIASKTQMFTERYMVDWLLQNSLGPMWLAMCKKHGWTPDAESTGTLDELEKRRVEWRAKRDAGEVELTDLMPLNSDLEKQWAYYVPQPIPDDAVEHANESVRDLKILDPAVGSGHFLVAAFDLLHALYQEEARHRGESDDTEKWSDQAIVERILEHNLNGIDLDSRAVQIAAAALWMKARLKCESAQPANLNLVASNLGIARLPHNDPALVELRRAVEEETGIPANLTNQIIEALQGADHLGSLLKVDTALDEAISQYEKDLGWENNAMQLKMFPDGRMEQEKLPFGKERVKANLLSEIETFLSKLVSGNDLGLRLRGEELAAGIRLLRVNRQETYDLVIANPPYQGSSKLSETLYVDTRYEAGKADLFSAFLLRGLELVRKNGTSAMLTMRNWLFTKQFVSLRAFLFEEADIRSLGDLDKGAFETMATSQLISVSLCVIRRTKPSVDHTVAIQPTAPGEKFWSRDRTELKRAAVLCQRRTFRFHLHQLKHIDMWPLVYWWTPDFLEEYENSVKLNEEGGARKGIDTGNNSQYVRRPWEVSFTVPVDLYATKWAPYVMGAKGLKWFEPLQNVVRWDSYGFPLKFRATISSGTTIRNTDCFGKVGIAYSTIGADFSARVHTYPSICDNGGTSVYVKELNRTVCILNSKRTSDVLSSLNPTVNFQAGDVNRIPVTRVGHAKQVFQTLSSAFKKHESHRETSVEFLQPGPSPWRKVQEWAQIAVDLEDGQPIPPYVEELDPEPPTDQLSFAIGVSLGRFQEKKAEVDTDGDSSSSLNNGILFLNGTLADDEFSGDSLGHIASKPIHHKWSELGNSIDARRGLRAWLRERFFSDVHVSMYENFPIYLPLSSSQRTFVAYVNIHRFDNQTLLVLLADHLVPAMTRIEGEIVDLKTAMQESEKESNSDAEQRYDDVTTWRDELNEFIVAVRHCAEKGPHSLDSNKTEREVDNPYEIDLDDGVRVNSAGLWALLEPQWPDPKKWWSELVAAKRKKDFDWSHLAMRYFPTRVDKKCQKNQSYAIAHRCFWKYHPALAWQWELRVQDEVGTQCRIEEGSYRGDGGHKVHRADYLRDNPEEALTTVEKEVLRRLKGADSIKEMTLLESGIWSALPEECWNLETKIIKKQKAEFQIVAPDEKKARKELLKAKPDLKKKRNELLDKYDTLFTDEPGEEVTA